MRQVLKPPDVLRPDPGVETASQNTPWIRNTIAANPSTPLMYQSHFLRVRTDIADKAMAI